MECNVIPIRNTQRILGARICADEDIFYSFYMF